VPITTARLRLDPLRVEDADEMAAVLASPSLYRHTGGEPPTVEALRERYASQVRGPGHDDEAWRNWVVREGDDGPAAVFVQATVTAAGAVADVAWVIGEPWQGGGYASEAARAMIDWLAAQGVRTVTAHVHPENEASARVADRVGLKPTLAMEDGELVWRVAIDPRLPTPAERRGRQATLSVLVGVALSGFGLFEMVMVRLGALDGGPDQAIRDGLLVIAGVAMAGVGTRHLRERRRSG